MFCERPGAPSTEKEREAKYAAMEAEYAAMAAEQDAQEAAAAPEGKRECGPEVSLFNELIEAFEREHSLEALHAIVELAPKDAPNHPVREPARKALVAIYEQLKIVENETNISSDELYELQQKRKRVSQAVGMINRGIVDHTR